MISVAGARARAFSDVKKKANSNSNFPYINQDFQMMVLEKSYETWEEAIKDVMLKMRGYKDPAFGSPDPRQASPLIIKVHKIGDKNYKVVLTAFLKTSLSPNLRVNWSKMEEFLATF